MVVTHEFATLDFPSAGDILAAFLQKVDVAADAIDAACFGVPGPVIDQRVQPTNVDWAVDARELQAKLKLKHVHLLNDLEAMAHVVPVLRDDELLVLQKGKRNPHGNGALLAAGTGLGQALLISVDGAWRPSPSEGGHVDFAPRTPREIELLQELIRLYGRAQTEHIVCGPGRDQRRAVHQPGAQLRLPRTATPATCRRASPRRRSSNAARTASRPSSCGSRSSARPPATSPWPGWPPAASTSAAASRRRSCRRSKRRRSSRRSTPRSPWTG